MIVSPSQPNSLPRAEQDKLNAHELMGSALLDSADDVLEDLWATGIMDHAGNEQNDSQRQPANQLWEQAWHPQTCFEAKTPVDPNETQDTDAADSAPPTRELGPIDQVSEIPEEQPQFHLTGRPAIPLYLSCDYFLFSPYQLLIRKNIEFFEASPDDVVTPAQGRPRPIVLGQVGVRCCFCSRHLHPSQRAPGAATYPSKRTGVYQAAQNIASIHWMGHCTHVSPEFREQLTSLRNQKSSKRASKSLWADHAMALGVSEDKDGLRYAPTVDALGFPSSATNTNSNKRRRSKVCRQISSDNGSQNADGSESVDDTSSTSKRRRMDCNSSISSSGEASTEDIDGEETTKAV